MATLTGALVQLPQGAPQRVNFPLVGAGLSLNEFKRLEHLLHFLQALAEHFDDMIDVIQRILDIRNGGGFGGLGRHRRGFIRERKLLLLPVRFPAFGFAAGRKRFERNFRFGLSALRWLQGRRAPKLVGSHRLFGPAAFSAAGAPAASPSAGATTRAAGS